MKPKINSTTWAFRLPMMPLSADQLTLGGSHTLYLVARRSVWRCGDQMLDDFCASVLKTWRGGGGADEISMDVRSGAAGRWAILGWTSLARFRGLKMAEGKSSVFGDSLPGKPALEEGRLSPLSEMVMKDGRRPRKRRSPEP